ncbi:MAG: efflux RND transporter periplasmic adaptor subunit [Candidatus Krumholzibacteriia bacterium]
MSPQTGVENMTKAMVVRSLIGVAVLAGLGGCAGERQETEGMREIPRNVRVLELQPSMVEEFFEVAGPVSPVRGADLAAEEIGPVVSIEVPKGAEVKEGQILLAQDRALLAAEMAAAEAARKTQDYNLDKVRRLHEAGKVSEIELLQAETAAAQARAQAEVAVRRHRRGAIRAPFDGVVVDRMVELGQYLAPGLPAVRVIDPYVLKLQAYLTDLQVPWVQPGQECRVALGDSPGEVSGTVSFVSLEADPATGKFRVEVRIPNPDLALRSGVIGRARLPKATTRGLAIPRDAVLAGRSGSQVFVVEGDRASLRSLELGADQGLMVVVESGLQAGDRLVVRGQRELRDGSLVAVTETAAARDGSLPTDPSVVRGADASGRIGSGDVAGGASR